MESGGAKRLTFNTGALSWNSDQDYAYVREITAAAGDPSFLRMTTYRLKES